MASTPSCSVKETWVHALELSEQGRVHEAVFQFERAYVELESQAAAAREMTASGKVRSLLKELQAKLEAEIEAHLNFLRGNLYAALNVRRTSSSKDVKKAYFDAARKYHPDKSRVSPKLFTIIKHAYETLSDPEARQRYTPDKSAEEWTLRRRDHSAALRATVGYVPTARSRPKPPPPKGVPPCKHPTDDVTPARVSSMRAAELKARLAAKGVDLRGHLERSELETALLKACGVSQSHDTVTPIDLPKTRDQARADPSPVDVPTNPRGPGAPLDLSALAAELRATAEKEKRRRRLDAVSVADLRALLSRYGHDAPSFFRRSALVASAVDAFAPKTGSDGDAGSKQTLFGAASTPSVQQSASSDDEKSPAQPAPAPAPEKTPAEPAPAPLGFVESLRARAVAPTELYTEPHAVAATDLDREGVQAEVDFWTNGVAASGLGNNASSLGKKMEADLELERLPVDALDPPLSPSPEPLAGGGWFWG